MAKAMMPTALAPTVELAEPRVKNLAEQIASAMNAEIHDFYAAVPCVHEVRAGYGEDAVTWLEGFWGLELHGGEYNPNAMPGCKVIEFELERCESRPNVGLVTKFFLSAKVMRW
jgi:hypothetical protein